jgi:hypothetical protein
VTDTNNSLEARAMTSQGENENMRRLISDYEFKLKQLTQDNEELRRRLQGLTDTTRKVADYENRITMLSQ